MSGAEPSDGKLEESPPNRAVEKTRPSAPLTATAIVDRAIGAGGVILAPGSETEKRLLIPVPLEWRPNIEGKYVVIEMTKYRDEMARELKKYLAGKGIEIDD